MKIVSLVFKFKPLGSFQTSVVIDELFTEPWDDFEDDFVRLATVLLWCLLKVRLCSPLQLVTLLVGASLDYPNSFV